MANEQDHDFSRLNAQIKNWERSDLKEENLRIMGQFLSGEVQDLDEVRFKCIRNCLLLQVVLETFPRANVCSDLLTEELYASKAENNGYEKYHVITVGQRPIEPALFLPDTIVKQMKDFTRMSEKLHGKCSFIFHTFNKRKMTESELSYQLNEIWHQHLNQSEGGAHENNMDKVSFTYFRKYNHR